MEILVKQKFTCKLFDYLNAQGPTFHHWRHEKMIKYKCFNKIITDYTCFYITRAFENNFLFLYSCGGELIQT